MTSMEELRVLYPHISPEDLAVVKENLDRYLLLAWEIVEEHRLAQASRSSPECGTIKGKVDSPQTNHP